MTSDWLWRTLSHNVSLLSLSWRRFLAFALFSFTLLFFETNASFAKGYILLCFSLWASALVKVWSMLLWNSAILPKHFSLNRCPHSCPLMIFTEFLVNRWAFSYWMLLLKLLRFLLQILKFFNLVINCLATWFLFWIALWNYCLQWHNWQLAVKVILASAFRMEFFHKISCISWPHP